MGEYPLGNVDAYVDQLARMYRDDVYKYVKALNDGNAAEADDITQEAFIRTYAYLRVHPCPIHKPLPWLLKVARNCFYNMRRGRQFATTESLEQRQGTYSQEKDTAPIEIADHQQPEMVAQDREAEAHIVQTVMALQPAKVKKVMVLLMENHSQQEIATILNLPIGSIKAYVSRGRVELRKSLKRVE